MPKKITNFTSIHQKLDEMVLNKDSLFKQIDKLLIVIEKKKCEQSIIDEVKRATKYIDDLLCMVINNKDNEDKLNESLLFLLEEYDDKIIKIMTLLNEEMERIKYVEGS